MLISVENLVQHFSYASRYIKVKCDPLNKATSTKEFYEDIDGKIKALSKPPPSNSLRNLSIL